MSGAGLHGLCLSRPSSRPCSWPPPHPALHTGDTVNEVMSLRSAELQGVSSQPDKGFIGFVKLAPCGQGPPGTRQHHRGKKEKQTMKLKGISFPELRLSHANQEHVSPWFLPLLFFFFFFLSLASVVQPCWPGSPLTQRHEPLGQPSWGTWPKNQSPGRTSGKKRHARGI